MTPLSTQDVDRMKAAGFFEGINLEKWEPCVSAGQVVYRLRSTWLEAVAQK